MDTKERPRGKEPEDILENLRSVQRGAARYVGGHETGDAACGWEEVDFLRRIGRRSLIEGLRLVRCGAV
jgi:hypothetical protein